MIVNQPAVRPFIHPSLLFLATPWVNFPQRLPGIVPRSHPLSLSYTVILTASLLADLDRVTLEQ